MSHAVLTISATMAREGEELVMPLAPSIIPHAVLRIALDAAYRVQILTNTSSELSYRAFPLSGYDTRRFTGEPRALNILRQYMVSARMIDAQHCVSKEPLFNDPRIGINWLTRGQRPYGAFIQVMGMFFTDQDRFIKAVLSVEPDLQELALIWALLGSDTQLLGFLQHGQRAALPYEDQTLDALERMFI